MYWNVVNTGHKDCRKICLAYLMKDENVHLMLLHHDFFYSSLHLISFSVRFYFYLFSFFLFVISVLFGLMEFVFGVGVHVSVWLWVLFSNNKYKTCFLDLFKRKLYLIWRRTNTHRHITFWNIRYTNTGFRYTKTHRTPFSVCVWIMHIFFYYMQMYVLHSTLTFTAQCNEIISSYQNTNRRENLKIGLILLFTNHLTYYNPGLRLFKL